MSGLISQNSLDIRLQKLICCIGTLGGKIADNLSIGSCYTEKLEKLKILIGYLEALECYSISDEDILATGTIKLISIPTSGVEINILVNGISISGIFTTTATGINSQSNALVNQINSYQSTYVATYTLGSQTITLTGLCTNDTISLTTSDEKLTYTVIGFSGGYCSINCLTEDQVLEMFERVSKYCEICFPSAEYNFVSTPEE